MAANILLIARNANTTFNVTRFIYNAIYHFLRGAVRVKSTLVLMILSIRGVVPTLLQFI